MGDRKMIVYSSVKAATKFRTLKIVESISAIGTATPAVTTAIVTSAAATTTSTDDRRYASSSSSTISSSEAARLFQRRATSGSATSVYYLKNLSGNQKEGKFAELMFTWLVGGPIAILGIGGMYKWMSSSTDDNNVSATECEVGAPEMNQNEHRERLDNWIKKKSAARSERRQMETTTSEMPTKLTLEKIEEMTID